MTDEERDRLTAIEDPELRTWVRIIIMDRDTTRRINVRMAEQHAGRAERLRKITALCMEPW